MLFAQRIKTARLENGLLQRQLAMVLNIDVPMYSRIEHGSRQAKREQVLILSDILNIEQEELLTLWMIDKITKVIGKDNDIAGKALKKITDDKIWR